MRSLIEIVKGMENPQGTVKGNGGVGVRVQIWNPWGTLTLKKGTPYS